MTTQEKISRALSRAYERARQGGRLPLGEDKSYVIFSDHHKGARTGADDFRQCELAYMAALSHYLENDYTLVVLGDVEELWEESADKVFTAYPAVFQKEADFYRADRYLRLYGNHDDVWQSEKKVKAKLARFYPNIGVDEGLIFEFSEGEGPTGEIFLAHGHQGTFGSDDIAPISRFVVRLFWRAFQILTGKGRTTPATDACLRATHDTQMYEWATSRPKLILIAGHTHRPVWSSMTHLQQVEMELQTLQELPSIQRSSDHEATVAQLQSQKQELEEKFPPCNDTIKTQPSYFNTGCCSFEDGDITGIELGQGQIRLVRWGKTDGTITRETLKQEDFSTIVEAL
jgi:UDP-2,3-diacylglucosamine pyrophosphatase LpxH